MATIAPFRGIRYDPAAVGDLARVVAPPYDVISEAGREALERTSPHNIVRLILGRDEPDDDETSNKYTRARGLLEAWQAAGVLRRDEDEALYIYEQRFDLAGERRSQRGVLAGVRLGDPGGDGVLPHERTYDDVVADRLELLRATCTNLDTIFCVYDGQDQAAQDAVGAVAAGEPLSRFTTDDGIEHLLWAMTDARAIAQVAASVAKATIVIADGHHRHRTAQRYAEERRAAEGPGPWDAQLMFLVDAGHHGPALLPIHRTLRGISADEALTRARAVLRVDAGPSDPDELLGEVTKRRIYGRTYGMHDGARGWILTVTDKVAEREAMPADRSAAWRDLDVAVLHAFVFERVLERTDSGYAHAPAEAAEAARASEDSLAFLLAPTPFESVRAVAEEGEPMPQKSTYFIPKPTTGIVLRSLDPGVSEEGPGGLA